MTNLRERTPLPQPEGHYCFGCGTANPVGLKLKFYRQGDTVCTDVRLGREHMGWEGISHGGIISTLLDEVMAWAVIAFRRTFFVTRRMEVLYHRPVPIGAPLVVCGEITPEAVANGCRTVGRIEDSQGQVLATAAADFADLPEEKVALIPAHIRADMDALYERMAQELGPVK